MPRKPVAPHSPKGHRPLALFPLLSICLSELRGDFGRLQKSRWDEAQRRKARELITALQEASHRHGLASLALLFHSLMGLTALPQGEAVQLGSALSDKLEELLKSAERLVSEQLRRQTA